MIIDVEFVYPILTGWDSLTYLWDDIYASRKMYKLLTIAEILNFRPGCPICSLHNCFKGKDSEFQFIPIPINFFSI